YDLYVRYGFYADHLERYLEHYPQSQIKIVFYEDMARDHQGYLKDVLAFLQVKTDFEPRSLGDRVNVGGASYLGELAAYALAPGQERLNLPPLAKDGIAGRLVMHGWRGVRHLSRGSARRVPMDQDARAFLEDTYAEPNAKLCSLLGRSVPFPRC
ncbi:MAG: sulfotransferase domain-containing protein, partial [Geminicoccales bacterium]